MNKEESKKQFGKNLKRLRMAKGMSQEELAKALGYTNRSSINKIEIGRSSIPTDKIKKTADILGVSPLKLFETEDDIKELIDKLPDLNEEDLTELDAVLGSYEEKDAPEMEFSRFDDALLSPDKLYDSNTKLLETYKKLSQNSRDELEKYAEYLLSRENDR